MTTSSTDWSGEMDPRLAERFGLRLRDCRQRAGLTKSALALVTELHRVEIGELEGGGRLPRLDTILKLSAGVEVPPRDLLADLHWRPGYYVAGDFYFDDGPRPDLEARVGAA
ncbi:MAG TPA: helix-turn-helix transcriptional regulator [Solirubrobacterales bacterium]|nr:helix-turn-helix transcriptional regulator [Solirubrobacterales bacterium]